MSNFATLREGLRMASATAAVLGLALPALAGEIYSWRTQDGTYAFSDDPKAVPARYRDQVETRATARLADYPRLTAPPEGSTDAYSQRLSSRLDHLRELNRDLDEWAARRRPGSQAEPLAIQAGNINIGVPQGSAGDGPVVIETVRFRHDSEMATRHNLVVRQGGKILTVIKGNPLAGPINQAPEISEMVD